ncbi:hypothetical protein BC830DRAFT_1134798 [Chytriomyces sp. MP71]|nr:hypothetical protein BC830DRAFT_1134798 [Chytriomyces sp. MP71]
MIPSGWFAGSIITHIVPFPNQHTNRFTINCAATSVPIRLLTSTFSLGMRGAILCIFGFNILGGSLVELCAIMGPTTGLRQMVIAINTGERIVSFSPC